MVIGHRTQRTACAGFLEKQRQSNHQHGRNHSRIHIFQVDQHTAWKNRVQQKDGLFGHAHIDLVNVAAKNSLAQTIDEVSDAQRGHEQSHAFLVDQVTQDQALNEPGQQKHQSGRQTKGDDVAQNLVVQTQYARHPFGKTSHGQSRKQHHRALCEIEHARRFENQHEAECHQGIQHAGHEAT